MNCKDCSSYLNFEIVNLLAVFFYKMEKRTVGTVLFSLHVLHGIYTIC